jgi:hypothetical protein
MEASRDFEFLGSASRYHILCLYKELLGRIHLSKPYSCVAMSFISKNVVEIEIASIYGVRSITASPRTMSIPNPHGQDLPPRGAYPEIQFKVFYPCRCHLLIVASPSRTRIQCRNRVTRRRGNHGVGTSKITGGYRRTTVSPIVHAIYLGFS